MLGNREWGLGNRKSKGAGCFTIPDSLLPIPSLSERQLHARRQLHAGRGRVLPMLANGARLLLPLLGGVSLPVLAIGAAVTAVALSRENTKVPKDIIIGVDPQSSRRLERRAAAVRRSRSSSWRATSRASVVASMPGPAWTWMT